MPAQRNCIAGVVSMFERVFIAARSAGSRRTAMHTTPVFSSDRRRPARSTRARLRSAPWAGKHRTRVASMSGIHFSLPPQRNPRAPRFADEVHRGLPCIGDQGCCARSFPRRPLTRRPGDIADDCRGHMTRAVSRGCSSWRRLSPSSAAAITSTGCQRCQLLRAVSIDASLCKS